MWLIYEQFKDVKEALNLNNVSKIMCDLSDNTLSFYGVAQDQDNDDTMVHLEVFVFESAKDVEGLYLAIMQEITTGAAVFEVKFVGVIPKPEQFIVNSGSLN